MSALDQVGEALRRGASAIRAANHRLSEIGEIAELQREVGPGVCCFCEEPVRAAQKGHSPPLCCDRAECRASYHRLYGRSRRARRWARGLTADGKTPKREKNRGRAGPFAPRRGDQ